VFQEPQESTAAQTRNYTRRVVHEKNKMKKKKKKKMKMKKNP